MNVKAPAGFPPPEGFPCARLLDWAPPFPLVGTGMGMGGERLGAKQVVEADELSFLPIRSDFPPPTPTPPHEGEGFARLFRAGRS